MDLPKYRIPRDLKSALEEIKYPTLVGSFINSFLVNNKFLPLLQILKNVDHPIEIEDCHYRQLLKLGLYLEEYEKGGSMSEFKICRPRIEEVQHSKRQFKIYFGYFHKNRTVLKIEDRLVAYEQSSPNTFYILKVLDVCSDHVIVSANEKFCKAYSIVADYNLELIFSNYFFQCCHDALAAIAPATISLYFFPKKEDSYCPEMIYRPTWFNEDISDNPEQAQAVLNIINKTAFPAPYILYGPPGTGKTSTLVEAICQIWKQQSSDCILVCATSNVACDVVAKRLLEYIPDIDDMYRLYSDFYDNYKIDEDIKKISNHNDKHYYCDPLNRAHFSNKKIIITTLCTAWRLHKFNLPFSHVFIDEAGQATQVEALIPLCLVKFSNRCQIVISGDHQLLGPDFVRSEFAWKLLGYCQKWLQIEIEEMKRIMQRHFTMVKTTDDFQRRDTRQSILEKLMKHEPYQKDEITGYDPLYITTLYRNYRSFEDIIHVPNELFYNNELITCSDEPKSSTLPVIAIYGVDGIEQKTSNSKSSYNESEISKVLFLVESHIGKQVGEKIIQGSDIGIVTPFTLQASKIREKLNAIGLNEVDVGNVEAYQGKEKEVIIISTVKSKHIGKYWNSRRFNVAVTRARASLLVVGNPRALRTDKQWWCFLKFCQQKNACYGKSLVIDDKFNDAFQRLSTKGGECKKSTDLFDETLANWEIDEDGHDESAIANFYYQYKPYYKAMTSMDGKWLLIIFISVIVLVCCLCSIVQEMIDDV